jgi:cytidyltransferase-like protein
MILKEGGNIFKDKKTGEHLTQAINQEDVIPTVKWLEQQTGLDLLSNMLGTTGKKATSGDLDLGVDETKISKDELVAKLLTIKGVLKDDVKKGGINVHLKTPITGDPSKGFVQTDFMFGDPEWLKFSMQGGGINSPYRGSHKHFLLGSIAKATKTEQFPEGMKWSYLNGLIDRATNETISKNPDEIAEVLFGKGYTGSDLSNVETIVNAIKDKPNFDELVAEANETFSKDKTSPVPPVTRSVGFLKEALEARIQHPEDMIYWDGSLGAQKAVNALLELAENATSTTTVKWDGSPAIVFGVDKNDKFILTDKGGFVVKSYKGRAESPEELSSMIQARGEKSGKDYSEFASSFSGIFEPFKNALKRLDKQSGEGVFFKGDLLYMKKPMLANGEFEFKPNVVTYKVPAKSDLGKKIAASTVGVVLHGIIKEDEQGNTIEEPIEDITNYFNGDLASGGLLAGSVLIFSPVFVNETPKFEMEMVEAAEALQAKVERASGLIDSVLDESKLTAKKIKDLPDVLYSYTNSKADNFASVSLDDFKTWVESNQKLSKQKIGNLLNYIAENEKGFQIIFQVVKNIEALKNKLVSQFDKQSTTVKAYIGDVAGGEGYVVKSSSGPIKLVNRGGFTAANRAIIREQASKLTSIGFYPGSFKPFHRGHYESILDAKKHVDKLMVIVSTADRIRPREFPLSGQASVQYIEKYIKPALEERGINVVVTSTSPVKYTFDSVVELDGSKDIEVYLFAGQEDMDRFNQQALLRNFPNLVADDRIHAVETKTIVGDTQRFSGTAAREIIKNNDLKAFKEILPPIKAVQRDAAEILELFKTAGEKIEADKKAEKESKKPNKPKTTKEVFAEMISLFVKEVLLEKKKKGRVHFPPEVEKIIRTKLKKQYKGNEKAIYAVATKIMKQMGLEKISKD